MKCYKCEDLMLVIKRLEYELQEAAAKIPESEPYKQVGSIWTVNKDDSLSSRVDKMIKEGDEALLRFNKKVQDEAKAIKEKKANK